MDDQARRAWSDSLQVVPPVQPVDVPHAAGPPPGPARPRRPDDGAGASAGTERAGGGTSASTLTARAASRLRSFARAALLALAVVLPFELEAPLARVGPLQLSSVEVFLYLALAAWLAARVAASIAAPPGGRLAWILPSRAHRALAALAIVMVVSAVSAPIERATALKFTLRSLGGMALFWASADLLAAGPRAVIRVAAALGVGAVAASLLMMAELYVPGAADRLRPFHAQTFQTFGLLRASGTFQYPNIAAMYLEAALPLALVAGVAGERRPALRLGLTTLAGGVIFYAIVLASSRAGVVTALALLLGLAVATRWHPPLRRVAAATLVLGLGLVAMTFGATDPLAGLRLQVWQSRPWYRSMITPDPRHVAPLPARLAPGTVTSEPLKLRNDGAIAWPRAGNHVVYVSYHWNDAMTGKTVVFEGARTILPHDVPPGDEVTLVAKIVAPARPGAYVLRWDLVQEDVTWFSLYGDRSVSQRVDVQPMAGHQVPGARSQAAVAAATTVTSGLPGGLSGSDAGGVPRRQLWTAALRAWRDHPLLGLGPDNFRHAYGRYLGLGEPDERLHANNFYLEVLASLGLAGLAAFGAVAVALGRALRGALGAPAGAARALALALAAALGAYAVHGALDYFLEFTPTYALLSLVAGMLAATAAEAARSAA